MMKLLFLGLLFYIGYRIVAALVAPRVAQPKTAARDTGETAHRDPVCGVYVSEDDAVIGRHNDQRLYFCSRDCLEKYREQLEHTTSP